MKMKRVPGRSLLLASLIGMAFVAPVHAQSSVLLERVEVALWPEYDRPGVLVIYRISLAPSTALPAPLTFTVPAAVGPPNAVAQMSGGNLVTLPYERVVDGDNAELRFAASERIIQLEYYDPSIAREADGRSFTYRWPGDYQVTALTFSIQEPAGAQEVQLTPPAGAAVIGADGLAYHTVTLGTLAAGQSSQVSLAYDKVGDALTSASLPAPPPVAAPGSTADTGGGGARAVSSPTSPWQTAAIAALLVLGLVGLTIGLLARFRPQPGAARGARRKGRTGGFCTQCGKGLSAGDRFCAGCGRPARSS
jgi:hypothetical protein